jgi:hypothetical protein
MITDDEEYSEPDQIRLYTINEGGSSVSGSSVSNFTTREIGKDKK